MNRCMPTVFAGVTLVMALACGPAAERPSTAADVQAINEVREREVAAFLGGNPDRFLEVFTDDCIVMPPNEPAVTGHVALRAWLEGIHEHFVLSGGYTDSDVVVAGDWAIERYTARLAVTPKAGGEAVEEPVKGIHIYQRQPDGTWRIAQDIWNVDTPVAGTE